MRITVNAIVIVLMMVTNLYAWSFSAVDKEEGGAWYFDEKSIERIGPNIYKADVRLESREQGHSGEMVKFYGVVFMGEKNDKDFHVTIGSGTKYVKGMPRGKTFDYMVQGWFSIDQPKGRLAKNIVNYFETNNERRYK